MPSLATSMNDRRTHVACPRCGEQIDRRGFAEHLRGRAHKLAEPEVQRILADTPPMPEREADPATWGRRFGEIAAALAALREEEARIKKGSPGAAAKLEKVRAARAALEAERESLHADLDPADPK